MYFSYVCYTSEATPITMVRSVLEATTLDDDSFRVRIHLRYSVTSKFIHILCSEYAPSIYGNIVILFSFYL